MTAPAQPVVLPASQRPTRTVAPFAFAVAAVLLIGAVVNVVALTGFPGNAPVEGVYSIGITIDLVVAGLILLVRGLRHRTRPLAETRPPSAGVLAIVAAVLAFVAFAAWLLLGGLSYLFGALDGARLRYMEGTAGLFFVGAAWCLSFIFAVVGYRRDGGTANRALTVVALVLSGLALVGAISAGVVYGLGLSD